MNHSTIHSTAQALHNAGLCVLPAATDGTKRPSVSSWRQYTQKGGSHPRPDTDRITRWFIDGPFDGLGIVTGAASGNIEMLELEGRAVAEGILAELTELATNSSLGDLWTRVVQGYSEWTPSGGLHILYRVDADPVAGNTHLARRPSTPEEFAAWKAERQAELDGEDLAADERARRQAKLDNITRPEQVPQVLIETRGEGGWVVLAPSGGRTHPTGRPWTMAAGGPATIATVTADERDALHHLAGAFDRMPITAPPVAAPRPALRALPTSPWFSQPATPYGVDGGISPGDDYNEKADWQRDILGPLGWTIVWVRSDGEVHWRRPGKTHGISATTGRGGADNLYVFTTSTVFDTERPYDKFGAYTLLNHGSTSQTAFEAAAKDLAAQGYGHRTEPTRPAPGPTPPPTHTVQAGPVIGNLATVHQLDPPPPPALALVEERTYEHSDDGNALALIDRFGDVIRYCADRGRWLSWDGQRWEWQPAGGGIVREYAKRVCRSFPDDGKTAVEHKKKALSAGGITSMLAQAQTDVRAVVAYADLDARPMELNTPAGIVDLATGELLAADAAHLHTRITRVAPDPGADPSRWHEFLDDTFGADPDLIAYLRRLVGYSATGSVKHHRLPFCVGSGGNGKGVFLEAIIAVLGDYATTAPSGFLMAKAHSQHETEIARLAGMRMVVCSEVGDDDRFDEVKVKLLTGGDSLTARFMRADHFTFEPTHKLWLMGNHQPKVRAGGRSFWRRLRLIPFDHEVPEEKVVEDLQGILARDHGPALLAWIIAGAVEATAQGLADPERVKAATLAYEADQDTVSRFVEDCCRIGGGEHVQIKISKLREAYERWCFTEGETPVTPKTLSTELARRHNVGSTRTKAARLYTGISLYTEDTDDSADASWPTAPAGVDEPGSVTQTNQPVTPAATDPGDPWASQGSAW
uniref:phage/plasmid primase, P4 family n=1 Tax=Herbidospora sakaeratensis TaxID=564415 RepID=UPI0007C7E9B4|nr:phage/plasmid primase, P4 family [Herbidospora sakaeratensis]